VRSICPGVLNCVVRHNGRSEKINKLREFSSYMITLQYLKQRGYEFFQKNYVQKESLSVDYKKYLVIIFKDFHKNRILSKRHLKIKSQFKEI